MIDSITSYTDFFLLIFRLFDGMEESMQTDNELRTIVLTCANTLLTSLLSLTGSPTSVQISDSFMEKINLLYDDLESCDYIGMFETQKVEQVPLITLMG